MPCYDKKLEAARDDLQTEGGAPETDCVLATTEVLELLAARGVDLRALPPAPPLRLSGALTVRAPPPPRRAAACAVWAAKKRKSKEFFRCLIRELNAGPHPLSPTGSFTKGALCHLS